MRRSVLVCGALALALGVWPALAQAQKKPAAKPTAAKAAASKAKRAKAGAAGVPATGDTIRAGEAQKPAATVQRGKGGVRVYRLEEIKVEGRIQKPTAFYVLQRSSLNYELDTLKQQFVPNILKSVSKSPF